MRHSDVSNCTKEVIKITYIKKRSSKSLKPKRLGPPPRKYRVKRVINKERKKFPEKFPFWARMKIAKNRTTLVIDEEPYFNSKSGRFNNKFVHREATHSYKKDYEEVIPNPDNKDNKPMYLKRPRKHPQELFKPHNKVLTMPENLKEKYSKNNK